MNEFNHTKENYKVTPPTKLLPLLQNIKRTYILWYECYQTIPKLHRHSLDHRIDTLFVESIESISIASFLVKEEKRPYVGIAIRKIDTIKILLMVLWEMKSLDNKKYIALSEKIKQPVHLPTHVS